MRPFANLSDDSEQGYFADGLTEDITTDLSRIAGSFVIARSSAFTYKASRKMLWDKGTNLALLALLSAEASNLEAMAQISYARHCGNGAPE